MHSVKYNLPQCMEEELWHTNESLDQALELILDGKETTKSILKLSFLKYTGEDSECEEITPKLLHIQCQYSCHDHRECLIDATKLQN